MAAEASPRSENVWKRGNRIVSFSLSILFMDSNGETSKSRLLGLLEMETANESRRLTLFSGFPYVRAG
eukprot:g82995.t1